MLTVLAFAAAVAGAAPALPDHLSVHAPKGSDYFGTTLTAPTVMVPVEGDFILAARLHVPFGNTYDGAALLVRADATHWAKLLAERSQPGMEGVTSSVVRGDSDNAYHVFFKPGQDTIWLKATRRGDTFAFYTSDDGKTWTIARDFSFGVSGPVGVGVEAQSPLGPEITADFDHVRLDHKGPSDYWQGE